LAADAIPLPGNYFLTIIGGNAWTPHPSVGLRWRAVVLARLNAWIPVVLWAGLIFALSSIPDLGTGLGVWDLVLRKLAHTAEYAIFGALVYRASRSAAGSVALASAYAITDEFHQAFVQGRHGSPLDWLIDTAGVVIGVLVAARASR
jgi:VanZ like protein